jgi:hypothetical protein
MKMPGFTAETSLYQSSQYYQMATSKNSLTHLPVLPQLRPLFTNRGLFWEEDSFSGNPNWASLNYPEAEFNRITGFPRETINPGIGDVRERQSRACVARCNRIIDPTDREECLFYCNP